MIVGLQTLQATLEDPHEQLLVILDSYTDKKLGAAGRDKLLSDLSSLMGVRITLFSETEEAGRAREPRVLGGDCKPDHAKARSENVVMPPPQGVDQRWSKLLEFKPEISPAPTNQKVAELELLEISVPAKLPENPYPVVVGQPKFGKKCPKCVGTVKPVGHRGRHTKYFK